MQAPAATATAGPRRDDAEQRYQLLFETSLSWPRPSTRRGPAVGGATPERGPWNSPTATSTGSGATTHGLPGLRPRRRLRRLLGRPRVRLYDWPCDRLALETRRAVTVASLDDPRLSEAERADMRRYGQRSFVVLPLIARDKVIGMVDLLDHVERKFSEEIATAEAVAQLVALALEHAQLYEEVKNLHLGNLRALSSRCPPRTTTPSATPAGSRPT